MFIIAFSNLCFEEYHYLYALLSDGLKGFQGQIICSSKVTSYSQSTLALKKISEILQSQEMCLTFSNPVFTIFDSGICLPLLPLKHINIFVEAGNGAGIADI